MKKEKAFECVKNCFDWIQTYMSTENCAANGIYERYLINHNGRSLCVRPDCNAEALRALLKYRERSCDCVYDRLIDNITEWLLKAQVTDCDDRLYGTFPFYLENGICHDGKLSHYLYQNDNGKIIVALIDCYRIIKDKRLLNSALLAADFWRGIQTKEGFFFDDLITQLQPASRGPCFSAWLALGMVMCYQETGDEKYRIAACKAFEYLKSLLTETGRIKTTYEVERGEAWRPASSENAVAMYCFVRSYEETGNDEYLLAARNIAEFLASLQHESGGILNCDLKTLDASEQNSTELCDLVYTQGFALMAFDVISEIDIKYIGIKNCLAQFLCDIQCKGESKLWDGAWRGAYNVKTKCWSGRASQNNLLEEGGMYAIYTGWCCMPICEGLIEATDKEKEK